MRSAPRFAWQNKIAKNFNMTDVPLKFCLLQGEIAEAFDAWRKDRDNLGGELADVAVTCSAWAQITGVNLQGEIGTKLAKNVSRNYRRPPNGVVVKSGDGPTADA
jgi:NTP pyrophosphatase (non-canonical NTP hydrolase)